MPDSLKPKFLLLLKLGPDGEVAPAAVAYELLERPVAVRPHFVWPVLRALLKAPEARLYAGWANDIWPARASMARQLFDKAGAGPDVLAGDLLGLADFLRRWYPQVMAPYERVRTVEHRVRGDPGDWASAEAVALEVSLAHDLGFVVASEVLTTRPGLKWGLKGSRLVFPGGYGEDLVEQAAVVLSRALRDADPGFAITNPQDPRSWAASRGRLRYVADVCLHQAAQVAAAPAPEPGAPLVLGPFRLPGGHALVRQADREETLVWATDSPVEGAAQLWWELNAARPEGKCCVLLGGPTTSPTGEERRCAMPPRRRVRSLPLTPPEC